MSHRQHKLNDQIMSNCIFCRDELRQAVGEERMHEIMVDAAKEHVDDAEVNEFMENWNEFMVRAEPQMFVQIMNLGDASTNPKVWLRYFGIDFMAECRVLRPKNKRRRRITATGATIEETLNNLASNVAEYLFPAGAS